MACAAMLRGHRLQLNTYLAESAFRYDWDIFHGLSDADRPGFILNGIFSKQIAAYHGVSAK
jgi:hypothetical protein